MPVYLNKPAPRVEGSFILCIHYIYAIIFRYKSIAHTKDLFIKSDNQKVTKMSPIFILEGVICFKEVLDQVKAPKGHVMSILK